jgi:hypothetical protein
LRRWCKALYRLQAAFGHRPTVQGASRSGAFLNPKQFDRLTELIRPKFPDIILALPIA